MRMLPFIAFVIYGVYLIAEVFIPSIRSSDFDKWEIDAGNEISITVLGWTKILSNPRVLASGYLSERSASGLSLAIGLLLVSIGILGIRHVTGIPPWIPDLFGGFGR
jgi:hypothetical protein